MAVFGYMAGDLDASVTRGTVVADSPRQARDELRRRGLSVHEIIEHRSRASWHRIALPRALLRRRGGRTKVVRFVREMSTLLGVGMPLLEAIDTAAGQQRDWFKPVLLTLRDRVASGTSLAEAMGEHPRVFDEVTIAMTEVGEDAGTLDQVLAELASFKERAAQFKGKVSAALLYPCIVLFTGAGVSIFLMTYVVPGLLDSLPEADRQLPLITRIVKTISDFLLHQWWLLLLGGIGAMMLLSLTASTTRGKRFLDRLLLRLPGIGDLVTKQAVARIAFVISTLMRSGIPFEKAVVIAQRSTSNVILREALDRCEQAVHAGRDIAAAVEQTKAFPSTVVRVLALGQQTGRLDEMLQRLAEDYDRQVASAASHLTAVLEPILILLLAAIVGAIAFAVILPILEVGHVL